MTNFRYANVLHVRQTHLENKFPDPFQYNSNTATTTTTTNNNNDNNDNNNNDNDNDNNNDNDFSNFKLPISGYARSAARQEGYLKFQ